jgi:hypothetical protein
MRAIVKTYLSRPSWSGRTIIEKKIVAKKENIINEVNDFIVKRIHQHNFISVTKFNVKIVNQHNDKVVNEWEYKPTYRQ